MASSESETLIYNASKIEDLAVELSGLLNQFKDEVDEMFIVIDQKMNQPYHWSGSVYETFKSKCDNFRKSEIESMISSLQFLNSSIVAFISSFFILPLIIPTETFNFFFLK